MDILIYIVLGLGAVVGFKQGAFKQVANFLGVAVGLLLAATLYHQFGDFLADKTGASMGFGRLIAFVLVVIVVPIALGWVAAFLTEFFKKLKLNFLNRLIGSLVGVFSYALILSVALNLFDFMISNAGFKPQKLSERSKLFYQMKHSTQIVIPDILIVTDSTEVVNGYEPKFGLKPVVNKTADKLNPFKNKEEETDEE
ncbi:MAG: CvpA family protein [Bacteroidales bacterium]|nr:CvpA family protein [Bacteroidales bacterium]